jgi:hypothetical protein
MGLLNICVGLLQQKRVTKVIAMIFMNSATPKAAAKPDLLLIKWASVKQKIELSCSFRRDQM